MNESVITLWSVCWYVWRMSVPIQNDCSNILWWLGYELFQVSGWSTIVAFGCQMLIIKAVWSELILLKVFLSRWLLIEEASVELSKNDALKGEGVWGFISRGLCSSSLSSQSVGGLQRYCAAEIMVGERGTLTVFQQWPYWGEAFIGTEGRGTSAEDAGPGTEQRALGKDYSEVHSYGLLSSLMDCFQSLMSFSLMLPSNGATIDSCSRFFPPKNANWVLLVSVTCWGLNKSGRGCSVGRSEPWEGARSTLSQCT